MPACEYCGKPIGKGDNFCINCGRELRFNPITQIIESLDTEIYCRKCGGRIKGPICRTCNGDASEYGKKVVEEIKKDQKNSIYHGLIIVLIFIVGIIIPVAQGSLMDMEKDSARANNIFVENWNEFAANTDKAADAEWLDGFDAVVESLYVIDKRWYNVDPRSVQSNDLVYYMVYADASYEQMKTLEKCKEFVHSVGQGKEDDNAIQQRIDALQNKFNDTMQGQESALKYHGITYMPRGIFEKVEYLYYDGIRFYLPQVNMFLVSIVLLAICLFAFIYVLNSFSADGPVSGSVLYECLERGKDFIYSFLYILKKLWLVLVKFVSIIGLFLSIFRIKNMSRCVLWMRQGLADCEDAYGKGRNTYKEYKREKNVAKVIGGVITILIFGVSFVVMKLIGYQDEIIAKEQYLSTAKAAAVDYFPDISEILLNVRETNSLEDVEREELYDLIDAQIEADQNILNYDMEGVEDYQNVHDGLCSLCTEDMKILQKIKDSIDNNKVSSQELMKNYASLRGKNYLWVLEELAFGSVDIFVKRAFE